MIYIFSMLGLKHCKIWQKKSKNSKVSLVLNCKFHVVNAFLVVSAWVSHNGNIHNEVIQLSKQIRISVGVAHVFLQQNNHILIHAAKGKTLYCCIMYSFITLSNAEYDKYTYSNKLTLRNKQRSHFFCSVHLLVGYSLWSWSVSPCPVGKCFSQYLNKCIPLFYSPSLTGLAAAVWLPASRRCQSPGHPLAKVRCNSDNGHAEVLWFESHRLHRSRDGRVSPVWQLLGFKVSETLEYLTVWDWVRI